MATVLEIDLRERRLVACRQRQLGPSFSAQPGQRELDVLAGAQRVDGEVWAGAEVLSTPTATHPSLSKKEEINKQSDEDQRDDPSSLTLVNATLIAKKFLKGYEGLELRGSVYNLFDKDWSMPIPAMTPAGLPAIPNDWPMPGINYLLEIKYTFD